MDYFVNIEHTPYYQWQIELLIESFKQHKLEENLAVGLSFTSLAPKIEFCRNLFSHPRTLGSNNMGEVRGYDRLAGLYSIANLLRGEAVKQPFVMLEPDSVLNRPVTIPRKDVPHIVFQVDPFFTKELAEENIPSLGKHLSGDWVALGNTVYFDHLPVEFFDRTIYLTEMLAYEQVMAGKEIWRHTDRVALSIGISELVGRAALEGQYTFDMSLSDHQVNNNFINYGGRGAFPYFSKSLFAYSPPTMLSLGGDPLDALAKLPTQLGTTSAQYVAGLAKICLDARKEAA
jgi:hypothetical protein